MLVSPKLRWEVTAGSLGSYQHIQVGDEIVIHTPMKTGNPTQLSNSSDTSKVYLGFYFFFFFCLIT